MKIAYVSPLPPVRSGIAQYSALLLPALAERLDVVAVVDQESVDAQGVPVIRAEELERKRGEFDAVVCQLGNNRHHEYAWRVANLGDAVIVLHDIVMHHLLVEMTIARGDAKSLDDALSSMYGDAGSAIAAARTHGIHDDLPNFLYPASEGVARSARHVIVHNRWAAERLRSNGVTTPLTVAPLAYGDVPPLNLEERDELRRRLGFEPRHRVIGVFGFVTHAKRPAAVMQAFGEARRSNDELRLLFVGEPAHNVDLDELATEAGLPVGTWAKTGFVSDDEFDRHLGAVDRIANLRYPSAGETSGPLMHAFAIGRPVAVSDYAQFADFPPNIVTRIPFEREIDSLARFMLTELDTDAIGAAQRAWLRDTSTLDHAVQAYVTALELRDSRVAPVQLAPLTALPLFPRLSAELVAVERQGGSVALTVRVSNEGDATIPAALSGQPPFVLFARVVAPGDADANVAVTLSGDLTPGRSALVTIVVDCDVARFTLELRHGLGGIPDVARPSFYAREVWV
ncbi:MAG: glycosyltransferase [Acidobacteria bacterium]|nr:glycosyltransferase [Acidobacteriota bacterium]